DFADVKTIMSDRGIAHMGVGRGKGEDRVQQAVQAAIDSPLLETSINGARAILLNVMGGYDLGMLEVNEAADKVQSAADKDVILIFGASIKEELQDEMIVTVIATGFDEIRPSDYVAAGLTSRGPLSSNSTNADPFNMNPGENATTEEGAEPNSDVAEADRDSSSLEGELDAQGEPIFNIPSFLQNRK
ncbi:MAG: cell division protein FtsZ, partial [Clostridiales bacterium]|nr:cell division protein FtsZ [Clostridiales bacterium]